MTDDNLFDRPPADWTDDEIRVGLAQLGQRITEHRGAADRLTEVAAALADERDRRRAVYAQMADAVTGPTARWLRSASTRRAERRGRRGRR